MKSMQRRVGGLLMKRKDDEADVGNILAEFKAVDEMLTQVTHHQPRPNRSHFIQLTHYISQLIKDLTAYRNSWDDILKL
ncbi:hypothetical protein LTR29_018313, partial [Friedmanniomyces endolithicus]